ncbi:TetR/AcrR family transcriptional regulator [Brevibacillus laterosporus]|uniref:TetR/AcrR family transcriptional regulator n=1 Tax=Brevibacillus laterosporus TaxID=1465 RepID=UPI000378DC2F|nr:TetR/AcrR family transcriptional regulator [Brevibacillus laterosporus]ATO47849.1 TetR family transcriptional regulator [Brevibacillus laterosporus DSM 25]MBG9803728.1 TetR family transcriptional regulator [Brevibacillus laterosporus]MED2005742.1 TetR/AcrR family transcriptional regulator [Brevibacillus laterosporus]MED4765562.1 TetR/AcrR family transcriptional regulator [Brevibacillus laterosporus]TPH21852.1 TetR/AcrR family transcriptional regulator [Brevibacillus laterosporus]
MTANKIKEAALQCFAQHGYEGTSLAQIADAVGIKKPSIYAHFKAKEDLFLHLIHDVFAKETAIIQQFFVVNQNQHLSVLLPQLLNHYKTNFTNDGTFTFWLRMAFFPPSSMVETVSDVTNQFLDELEAMLVPFFKRAKELGEIQVDDPQDAAIAFLCLMDGLFAELLFGGSERYEKRWASSWKIFAEGIHLQLHK